MSLFKENYVTANNLTQKRHRQKYGIVRTALADSGASLLRLLWDDVKFVAIVTWALAWSIPLLVCLFTLIVVAFCAQGKRGVERVLDITL